MTASWILHNLLRDAPLDLFVLFSSAAAILSSPLWGVYAAGSAFQDALASYRRARGLAATTINWGFWDRVGMTARWERETGSRHRPRGRPR